MKQNQRHMDCTMTDLMQKNVGNTTLRSPVSDGSLIRVKYGKSWSRVACQR